MDQTFRPLCDDDETLIGFAGGDGQSWRRLADLECAEWPVPEARAMRIELRRRHGLALVDAGGTGPRDRRPYLFLRGWAQVRLERSRFRAILGLASPWAWNEADLLRVFRRRRHGARGPGAGVAVPLRQRHRPEERRSLYRQLGR